MKVALICATFLLCFAAAEDNFLTKVLDAEKQVNSWNDFKKQYNKTYTDEVEELKRFAIFVDHVMKINQHNVEEALDGRHGFTTAINKFADLTSEEFIKIYNGYKPRSKTDDAPVFLAPENVVLPATVDWRTKGYVTGIKNQGQCGSCWAFSAVGSLEGQHFKKTGKLVSLSEQNLVDCVTADAGCGGGLMEDAFTYIKTNKGVDTEKSYPYTAQDGKCHFNRKNIGATDKGYIDVKSKDEQALQKAVATVGPIAVAIDASHFSFQMYSKGVYNEPKCKSKNEDLDHGVVAVGYGTDNGKAYWLVKNSWGEDWGMNGYIQMSRNKNNQCGIATDANYPIV